MGLFKRRGTVVLTFEGKDYKLRPGDKLDLTLNVDEKRTAGGGDGIRSYDVRASITALIAVKEVR